MKGVFIWGVSQIGICTHGADDIQVDKGVLVIAAKGVFAHVEMTLYMRMSGWTVIAVQGYLCPQIAVLICGLHPIFDFG